MNNKLLNFQSRESLCTIEERFHEEKFHIHLMAAMRLQRNAIQPSQKLRSLEKIGPGRMFLKLL